MLAGNEKRVFYFLRRDLVSKYSTVYPWAVLSSIYVMLLYPRAKSICT